MPPVQVILIAAAAGALWWGGVKVEHGLKKASLAVCHTITLQHKCQPKPKPEK